MTEIDKMRTVMMTLNQSKPIAVTPGRDGRNMPLKSNDDEDNNYTRNWLYPHEWPHL